MRRGDSEYRVEDSEDVSRKHRYKVMMWRRSVRKGKVGVSLCEGYDLL